MILHDYSDLLRAISDLKTEKEQEKNRIRSNKVNEVLELESYLIKSGILEDWRQLKISCKSAGVRIMPYGTYDEDERFRYKTLMRDFYMFLDNGRFATEIIDMDYSCNFGFTSNETGNIIWRPSQLKYQESETELCERKLYVMHKFLELYEEYKYIQLSRIYAKMAQMENEIKNLKTK